MIEELVKVEKEKNKSQPGRRYLPCISPIKNYHPEYTKISYK